MPERRFSRRTLRRTATPAKRHKFKMEVVTELTRARPDVLIVGGYWPAPQVTTLLYARWHGVPYVLLYDSNIMNELRKPRIKRLIKWGILRFLLADVGAAIAAGQYSRDFIRYYLGVPDERVFLGSTPFNQEFFAEQGRLLRPRKAELRRQLGLCADRVVFVFAGRFAEVKGLRFLLGAYSELEPRLPIELVLMGMGPARSKWMDRYIARKRLKHVHFPGFLPEREIPAWLAAGDVFVTSSINEPWGVVLPEAMAAGLPAISTRVVGSAPHFMREGETGYIVPEADSSALREAMAKCVARREELQRMGLAAAAATEGWKVGKVAENYRRATYMALGRPIGLNLLT
jgi:glycosyltransferase involved in cell wall biosynthesis